MADHQTGLLGLYNEHPEVREAVDSGALTSLAAAEKIKALGLQTSERAVRRLRTRLGEEGTVSSTPPAVRDMDSGRMTLVADREGSFENVVTEEPLEGNWDSVFKRFNLDPGQFQIVDDTVRMSTWQQSKRTESGDRDSINLYAYSARFKRRVDSDLSPEVLERWRTSLQSWWSVDHTTYTDSGWGTYLILIADPQLGKKGTAEAVENWKRGVRAHIDEIKFLQRQGTPVERVHVAWMGDETEGVANNYTNQPHTIELNQAEQLELDFDLRMWTLREVLSLGYPVSASSVISNHGEWTRNGGKDVVTTRNDNASTHIARQVKKAFYMLEPYGVPKIAWTIGDDKPGVVVELSGVDCYFSHGYIEKGKGASTEIRTKNAIERQILGDTDRLRTVPLYFMAHYHHFYSQEFEGRTLFGMPALEAERSSEYMHHQYGVWSPPGMLGLVVGRDSARGWSHLSVH